MALRLPDHAPLVTVLEQRLLLTVRYVECVAASILRVLIRVDVIVGSKVLVGANLLAAVDGPLWRVHFILKTLLSAARLPGALGGTRLLAHLVLITVVVEVIVG